MAMIEDVYELWLEFMSANQTYMDNYKFTLDSCLYRITWNPYKTHSTSCLDMVSRVSRTTCGLSTRHLINVLLKDYLVSLGFLNDRHEDE